MNRNSRRHSVIVCIRLGYINMFFNNEIIMGISPAAACDQRRRLWNPQFFEKN